MLSKISTKNYYLALKILDFCQDRWLTIKEISDELNVARVDLRQLLRILKDKNLLHFKIENNIKTFNQNLNILS